MNYTTSEPAHLKAGHPVFERNRRRLQIEADERDRRERSGNARQSVLEENLEDVFDRYGPDADQTHQAVFKYILNRAETVGQTRTMAPPVAESSKLVRKRREAILRVSDRDDYVNDLCMTILEKRVLAQFKGLNAAGEPISFAHWLNAIFRRNFAKRWKEEKVYDEVHIHLDDNPDERWDKKFKTMTSENLNIEMYSDGTKRNGDVSADFGTSEPGSPFHSGDPEVRIKVAAIMQNFRRKNPQLADALAKGETQREAAKLCGISTAQVSKLLSRAEQKLDKVGKRATGRVYAKPKGWTGPKSAAWLAREETRKQREKENHRLSESIRRRGKPRKAEVITISASADVRHAGVAA
jgi:DNA-directed RNA polymerase specialized sigma24 family protein